MICKHDDGLNFLAGSADATLPLDTVKFARRTRLVGATIAVGPLNARLLARHTI